MSELYHFLTAAPLHDLAALFCFAIAAGCLGCFVILINR